MDTKGVLSERNSILLIGDDKLNREMMQQIFSVRYSCVEAQEGREGLKMVEEHMDKLCAILLDVSKPVQNALDFLRIIHSQGITKKIPVFMVAESTEYDIVQQGYELGVMDVVTKPVQPFVIMRRVENVIELFKTRENLSGTAVGQTEEYIRNIPLREVADILVLMAAIQSVYDMIICANLSKNSYYMIDYDRFMTHCAGYDGVFDDLIIAGATTIPESHREAFTESFSREKLLEAHKQGRKSVHLEHPQYTDGGEMHMVSTTVMFVDDPKTEDVLEITLARYIDEEWEEKEKTKQILRDALSVAEKANRAKSDFLSRISHDIRTPLNAIMGMATIIGANSNDEEKIKECVSKIGVSSKHLLALINNVLDFSQIESGNMSLVETEFDIRNMTEEVRTMVAERALSKNQQLDIVVSNEVESFYKGDEFRVRQILINLLDNAYKYTSEGGKYSLSITVGKRTNTHHYLVFTIEDNGIGICETCMEKIFNPFVQCGDTTDNKGVGLGLAITRNLVHLMDGKMDVESKVGVGTKFVVELPFQACTEVKEICVAQVSNCEVLFAEKSKYSGEKILVAEDNELNQDIIKTILEMENLQVDIATNGQEVVEKFVNSKQGEYLVIFMDIAMPIMDGYEAAKSIRKSSHIEAASIPIYALTANAFYSDVVEAKASGMNGHLAKPIDFVEVSKILSQAVDEREAQKG